MLFRSLFLWLGSTAFFLIRPLKEAYFHLFSAVVVLSQTVIEARLDEGAAPSSQVISFDRWKKFTIVPDSSTRPEFVFPDPLVAELADDLRAKIDHSIHIYEERDKPFLWIQLSARNQVFWAVLPMTEPLVPYHLMTAIAIGISLSIVGAYLIIHRLTRQLRTLTAAVKAVGRGEPPVARDESGPKEVQELSRGFNQMAADLQKLDDDRRLMLAGISHDLKTPLTRLQIAVELTAAHAEPDIAAGIVHDIEDMDSILTQFLDYARDGKEEHSAPNDLDALILEIVERYSARGIRVIAAIGNIPPFPFRKLAMSRVITNLINKPFVTAAARSGWRLKMWGKPPTFRSRIRGQESAAAILRISSKPSPAKASPAPSQERASASPSWTASCAATAANSICKTAPKEASSRASSYRLIVNRRQDGHGPAGEAAGLNPITTYAMVAIIGDSAASLTTRSSSATSASLKAAAPCTATTACLQTQSAVPALPRSP